MSPSVFFPLDLTEVHFLKFTVSGFDFQRSLLCVLIKTMRHRCSFYTLLAMLEMTQSDKSLGDNRVLSRMLGLYSPPPQTYNGGIFTADRVTI